MKKVIVVFKIDLDLGIDENSDGVNDYFRGIAEKNEMELISWGII